MLLVASVVDERGVRVCAVYKYPLCSCCDEPAEINKVGCLCARGGVRRRPETLCLLPPSSVREREGTGVCRRRAGSACVAEASPNSWRVTGRTHSLLSVFEKFDFHAILSFFEYIAFASSAHSFHLYFIFLLLINAHRYYFVRLFCYKRTNG